jgi:hypothetical protein
LSPNAIQIANAIVGYLATLPGQRGQPVNIVSAAANTTRVADFVNVVEAAGKRIDVRVTVPDPSMRDFTVFEPDMRRSAKNSAWIISAPNPAPAAIASGDPTRPGRGPHHYRRGHTGPSADPTYIQQSERNRHFAIRS